MLVGNEVRMPTVVRELTTSLLTSRPVTADQSDSSHFSPANQASPNVDGTAMLQAVNKVADVCI